jgi:hypothetical protein
MPVSVHRAILKPIWTFGVQLWGSASKSNIETLEIFQSKVLRIITDARRCVPNAVIKRDLTLNLLTTTIVAPPSNASKWQMGFNSAFKGLKVLSVKQAERNCSVTYRHRIDDHPNRLAKSLFQRTTYNRRLKRYYPADLATRF